MDIVWTGLLLVGPLSYIAVVGTWAALLAVGWALVFWPQLPQGFNFEQLDPAAHSGSSTPSTSPEKLAEADPELLEGLLASFAEQLVRARRDLIHLPIVHCFRTEDEERALAGWRSTTSPRRCDEG